MKTKSFVKKMTLAFLLVFIAVSQNVKAESTVYFFYDILMTNSEYVVTVNGKNAFTLTPEVHKEYKSIGQTVYKKVMRKVIFKKSDSYVVALDSPLQNRVYHAELNLNLEDGETYYVIINASMKHSFFIENLSEKDGEKLLKKAQKDKKYTINEDFVYKGK